MTERNIEMYEPDNQLVISFELICLLKWMLENEDENIKKMISRALRSGLKDELNKKHQISKELMLSDIQDVLLEFFDMMEVLLVEALSEEAIKKALEKNLMPSIDQIDSSVCDDATVRFSIEKAASKVEQNPKENIREALLQELLKRWKPRKKNILN